MEQSCVPACELTSPPALPKRPGIWDVTHRRQGCGWSPETVGKGATEGWEVPKLHVGLQSFIHREARLGCVSSPFGNGTPIGCKYSTHTE